MRFMYELQSLAEQIDYELEQLNNNILGLELRDADLNYFAKETAIIADEMLRLNDAMYISAKEFNYSEIDYWVSAYFDASFNPLNEAFICLEEQNITEETFSVIQEKILLSNSIWSEKFLDAFEDWFEGIKADRGLNLCEDAVIYTEDATEIAFFQMLQNALLAEKLYYSLSRNKNKTALMPFKQDLISNRQTTGKTRPIQAQQLSGRRLISLNVASLEEAIAAAQPAQIANSNQMPQVLNFHRTKTKNFNRESVIRGYLEYNNRREPLKISYQFQPVPGQIANMHNTGVGRYGIGFSGKKRNILQIINELTQQIQAKEQKLARLLLRYKRGDGSALEEATLIKAGIELPKYAKERRTLIGQFNRAAYLICFQEVYRRKNQGYRFANNQQLKEVPELPFGIAVACLLNLIADGHLRMADALGENSLYGVFTGTGVMSENLKQTIEKFNELFVCFVEKYANRSYQLYEYSESTEVCNVTFTPEYFHTILRKADGDEEDSDNENYGVQANVTNSLDELSVSIENLTLKPLRYKA